ncbi:MAG TPA: PQQ-binding-like beta-propeller repeat protein, partial [Pyrinomonadaceae bacterium]
AIDTRDGDVKWRYKGADKGLTNFVFAAANFLLIADKDELIALNASTGKKLWGLSHGVESAQFVLLNESGDVVVGGRDEIVAFDVAIRSHSMTTSTFVVNGKEAQTVPAFKEKWRVRHKAPGRGTFRIIAGIALRATALYFRYGGLATSAFGLARGGLTLAGAANSFRWSGVRSRFGSFDLTTLASRAARNYVSDQIYTFGSLARTASVGTRANGVRVIRGGIARGITPSRAEVRESVFDRLDPARYADRLSDYLLRRKRLSELRGNHMYFYTDLSRPFDRKGLVGVNIHTGKDVRFILASDPDQHFVTDETLNLLYSADGDKLQAFDIMSR